MYAFGQKLTRDTHFADHIEHEVPVQIYLETTHKDIGFVDKYTELHIEMNNVFYNRTLYTFVSRPGY